jgi:NADPH-dependent ferric siderophore reductase
MALTSRLVKPLTQELVHLTVLRKEQLAPHWMRITLGGGEIERFRPMGYDQWFRIFLPLGGEEGMERLPAKANRLFGYLRYLRIPDGVRPVMRNYSVRAFRPAGEGASAEIDVDFVLHGSAEDGTAGPASRWAESCEPGESVVLIDEGLAFNPERGTDRVLLVGDETALPAVSSVCASLPATASGRVLVEVPSVEDALDFPRPDAVEVEWIVRGHDDKPGMLALARLAALTDAEYPAAPFHAYLAGEQALPTEGRRHLVARGVDKDRISFCGYWRVGAASPTPKSQVAGAEARA